jgi:dipeptidyl aminopeptidase/acylaminoacyl peptidase
MVQAGQSPFHEYTWLAQTGYAVVTCNPRGSTGYGAKHGAAIYADWGNKDMKDLLAVREETLRRHPQFDPKRAFIMGGSYGGYATNWMITRKPGLFRAAVTDRCVFNSLSFAGTSDFSNVFPPSEMGLSNIWEDPMKVWKLSPASLLPNVTEPLLILHSDNDWRCPISQAEELFTGLVELGKRIGEDVRLVMFKGESHGLSRGGRPENRRVRLEEILAWIRKHDRPKD